MYIYTCIPLSLSVSLSISLSLSLSLTHSPTHSLTLTPSQHPDVYESLDDNFFSADVGSSSDDVSVRAMKRPLMPQGCGPDVALQHFARNFEQRYGPTHPLFYVGALSAAVKEATSGSASSGTVGHV